MKTYKVFEIVTTCYCYSVDADDEMDAETKLESAGFQEGDGIGRESEYDDVISRVSQCEGEFYGG